MISTKELFSSKTSDEDEKTNYRDDFFAQCCDTTTDE